MNYTEGIKRTALVIYVIWSIILLGVMWLLSYSYPMELYWLTPLTGLLFPLIPLKGESNGIIRSFHTKAFDDYGVTSGIFIMLAYLATATFVYPWAQMHLGSKPSGALILLIWASPTLASLTSLALGTISGALLRFMADGFRQDHR